MTLELLGRPAIRAREGKGEIVERMERMALRAHPEMMVTLEMLEHLEFRELMDQWEAQVPRETEEKLV